MGISSIVLENINVNAVLRHVGRAMHEANQLVAPLMHSWPLNHLPGINWRGCTPVEAAKAAGRRPSGHQSFSQAPTALPTRQVLAVPSPWKISSVLLGLMTRPKTKQTWFMLSKCELSKLYKHLSNLSLSMSAIVKCAVQSVLLLSNAGLVSRSV